VSANLCKKLIRNKISPFFHSITFHKRHKGLAAAAGDIMSVGGNMMALAGLPQIQQFD